MKEYKTIEIRENELELIEIATRAEKALVADFNYTIESPHAILTLAYVYMKNMVKYLAENKSMEKTVEINFINLFNIGISYRENEDAEKEGNFVPVISASTAVDQLMAKAASK